MRTRSIETNPVLAEAARGCEGSGRPFAAHIQWPLLFLAVLAYIMFTLAEAVCSYEGVLR